MSKLIYTLLVLFFVNGSVFAQETTTPVTTGKNRTENQIEAENRSGNSSTTGAVIREENRERVTERVEANKEKAVQKRNENIHKYYLNMKARLLAAVERLKKLGERISARLDKEEAKGIDVVNLQLQLSNQQIKLTAIEANITNLDNEEELILASNSPQTVFLQLKNSLSKIKEDLKAVHQAYVQIITQLKTVIPTKVIPTVGQN